MKGVFMGVPIVRIRVFWGSILGSPYFTKLPNSLTPYAKQEFEERIQ